VVCAPRPSGCPPATATMLPRRGTCWRRFRWRSGRSTSTSERSGSSSSSSSGLRGLPAPPRRGWCRGQAAAERRQRGRRAGGSSSSSSSSSRAAAGQQRGRRGARAVCHHGRQHLQRPAGAAQAGGRRWGGVGSHGAVAQGSCWRRASCLAKCGCKSPGLLEPPAAMKLAALLATALRLPPAPLPREGCARGGKGRERTWPGLSGAGVRWRSKLPRAPQKDAPAHIPRP
jgi:hypothetical protein